MHADDWSYKGYLLTRWTRVIPAHPKSAAVVAAWLHFRQMERTLFTATVWEVEDGNWQATTILETSSACVSVLQCRTMANGSQVEWLGARCLFQLLGTRQRLKKHMRMGGDYYGNNKADFPPDVTRATMH